MYICIIQYVCVCVNVLKALITKRIINMALNACVYVHMYVYVCISICLLFICQMSVCMCIFVVAVVIVFARSRSEQPLVRTFTQYYVITATFCFHFTIMVELILIYNDIVLNCYVAVAIAVVILIIWPCSYCYCCYFEFYSHYRVVCRVNIALVN